MSRRLWAPTPGLMSIILTAPLVLAQLRPAQSNRLLTAKVIYVEPMPDHLDQWIAEDLRAWGKYQIASNEQGVDLVIKAQKPEARSPFTPHTVPPVMRRQRKEPPVLSLTVVNWVTGERMWKADVLNSGPKKNEKEPAGPETEVYARHMTPDQIATRSVDLLRRYVEELQQAPAAKP